MDRKKLLITNDDGIHAEGLKLLVNLLKDQFSITVVAPDNEKSGAGMSITGLSPIQVKRVNLAEGVKAYSVKGTPTDCVKLALSGGFIDFPDLVVSGINPGSNAGRNIFYSGTVGAAIQGAMGGVQSAAFSMHSYTKPNYEAALSTIENIINHLVEHPLPIETLLNVNFPSTSPYKGLKWTRQGRGFWKEFPHTSDDLANGEASFWLGHKEHTPEEEDSDTKWLAEGYITLVPVKISDLTDTNLLDQRKNFTLSNKVL